MKSPMTGYLGGKRKLANKIIERLPEHACYAEPFAGGAAVLFRKEPSPSEVINDINSDLVNLYRVVQNHLEEFVRHFKWTLVSREEFDRLHRLPGELLTDIQRASRYYYLQKVSFAGRGRNFGYSTTAPSRLNLLRIEEELSAAHLRLARVTIEHQPYAKLIERYDRPATVFYIDPPYWDCENDYGRGIFGKSDFTRLADLLGSIQGRFLMSCNDAPQIREIFRAFRIEQVTTCYSCSRGDRPRVNELFITNYEPELGAKKAV